MDPSADPVPGRTLSERLNPSNLLPEQVLRSGEERTRRVASLRGRIEECERHKSSIMENISRIRQEDREKGVSPIDSNRRIEAYLGERSFDEWMMLYDVHIDDARAELEALDGSAPLAERVQERRALVIASAAAGLFLLVVSVFFLPTPVSVLTGNAVAASPVPVAQGLLALLVAFSGIFLLAVSARAAR